VIERPVFVVAPPRSGAPLVSAVLSSSSDITGSSNRVPWNELPGIHPQERGWESDRLTAEHATPEVVEAWQQESVALADDEQAETARLLDGSPKNALRIPFLDALFPDARFVYVYREPRKTLPGIVEGWQSGRFATYRDLPGWQGPAWSFLLVPGWRDLIGKPLAEIATEQWIRTAEVMLEDLQRLPAERWCVVDYSSFSAHTEREWERVGGFLELDTSAQMPDSLPQLRHSQKPPQRRQMKEHTKAIDAALPRTTQLAERAKDWVARVPGSQDRPAAPPDSESPLRSVFTATIPQFLAQLSSSLLVSTYQTGKLICARQSGGALNTHFRDFNRPMGLAVHGERLAIGTRSEVWDYRNVPDAAAKVEPKGSHDAAFVPRNVHQTGDIGIHEIAFAEGELWIIATNFSCLATLDADHSFIPRWRPPFVSALAPEDRCHLNGLCVIDDRIQFVTALGETDTAGGWRENKASGGVLIDVDSGETLLRGLSMPHSPRWHDDRLWLLESGRGAISVADLEAGTWETVAELPGFTRGLAFAGPLAFVGLSQIRETSTFGGLPIEERVKERLCGVWVVDTGSGETVGFLRFEDLVQEVFDVAFLPGSRFPEIAEPHGDTTAYSYVLPEEALAEVAQSAEPAG
jgi:uncharacterized protein (TIGR03032 family)